MQAGYSGTPLIQKLGIRENMRLLLIHQPDDYFEMLGKDLSSHVCSKKEKPDLIHLFVKTEKEFISEMKKLEAVLKDNIILWVSWYKKSSKISTDITEDTIRNYALSHNLVDIKVCAVNEVWSGLKLVIPLDKR